jgi:hypothetical protein
MNSTCSLPYCGLIPRVGWGALKKLWIRRMVSSKVEKYWRVSSVLSIAQFGIASSCKVRGGLGRGLVKGLGAPVLLYFNIIFLFSYLLLLFSVFNLHA